jgi:tyrosine-protein kinase Etk/Wzc
LWLLRLKMIPTEVQTETTLDENSPDLFRMQNNEASVLDMLVLLSRRRRFILRFVAVSAVLAVILALLLPVKYEAKTVLLPPAQNSSIGTSLMELGNAGSLGSLAALAGGSFGLKNPSDMYVALLTSRTVEDAVIRRFGLMQEYHLKRMTDTRKRLENNTTAVAGTKDGLIRLTVEDHDANRAAALANGYVEEFRRLSASLAITEAARRRQFFEQQVQDAKEKLTAAEDAMAKTQQSTGVLQIDSQARALIESASVLRAQVMAKQVQIEGMQSFANDDYPALKLAKQELAALEAQLQRIAGSQQDTGSDINLSKGRVTKEGLEYLRRYRDLKYDETVFELLAKEFEIAKLDEAREGSIVQVVDPAIPPDKKSSPHRTLIVLGITVLSFFVSVFWVLARQRFALASALPENRHRLRIIREVWTRKRKGV